MGKGRKGEKKKGNSFFGLKFSVRYDIRDPGFLTRCPDILPRTKAPLDRTPRSTSDNIPGPKSTPFVILTYNITIRWGLCLGGNFPPFNVPRQYLSVDKRNIQHAKYDNRSHRTSELSTAPTTCCCSVDYMLLLCYLGLSPLRMQH